MIKDLNCRQLLLLASGILALGSCIAVAQEPGSARQEDAGARAPTVGPTSLREAELRAEKLRIELLGPYRKWLLEDVTYIITLKEQRAYKDLKTDQERDRFIEEFWSRRDPTTNTTEDEFKEEHYRRIAYANERFASSIPGWKSDQGEIYITYGPPDEIVRGVSSECSAQTVFTPSVGQTTLFPLEKWHYRFIYVKGNGMAADFTFVDSTGSGQYYLTQCPPGQRTPIEVSDDYNRESWNTFTGNRRQPFPGSMEEFERLERSVARAKKPPTARFPDLVAVADSKSTANFLPMLARADFFPTTSNATLTNITVGFDPADLKFNQAGPVAKATVNLYAVVRTTTLRAETVIEDVLNIEAPTQLFRENHHSLNLYQRSVPLAPGRYRLNIVAKDTLSGRTNNLEMLLDVPRLEDDRLAVSSVVLADWVVTASSAQMCRGEFIIGDSKIRPRMNASFRRDEKLNIYLKVYNLGADEKTFRPRGEVTFEIVGFAGNTKPLHHYTESLSAFEGAASETTIVKLLALGNLKPGKYILRLKVYDKIREATAAQTAEFVVVP